MRVVIALLCIGLVKFASAQNNSPGSDFNFGLFSKGNNDGGTNLSPGAGSNGMSPTSLSQSPSSFQNNFQQQSNAVGGIIPTSNQQSMGALGAQSSMNTQQGMGMNTAMNQGMGMNQMSNMGMGGQMNPGMNQMGGQMNPGMSQMSGQMNQMSAGMGQMNGGAMVPGMQMANTNNMMQQSQFGMAQAGASGDAFQDPTTMGNFNRGSFNQMGFNPQTQGNLFQDQLSTQNNLGFQQPNQFGSFQTQFGGMAGMNQFPQMPQFGMGQQRFASPFPGQPTQFGPFNDRFMNMFAPFNPMMGPRPMMPPGMFGPMPGMPGMQMSNTIFDANGFPVGSVGGRTSSGLSQTGSSQAITGFGFPSAGSGAGGFPGAPGAFGRQPGGMGQAGGLTQSGMIPQGFGLGLPPMRPQIGKKKK